MLEVLVRVGVGPKESVATVGSARYGPVPVGVALILRVPVGGGSESAAGPRREGRPRPLTDGGVL
ncbi:hypothetical protein GCM10028793_48090 [Nocardiopsis oceani]